MAGRLHPIQVAGDIVHLLSYIILLYQIISRKSCSGISLKSRVLYLIVYLSRYADIFTNTLSAYLTLMKAVYIGLNSLVIYLMFMRYNKTYSRSADTFPKPGRLIVLPCAVLALIFNKRLALREILWAFSRHLEAVAILPQIWLLMHAEGSSRTFMSHYVAALGAYRLLYLANWVHRAWTEPRYRETIIWITGFVQALLYADFYFYYVKYVIKNKEFDLPRAEVA